MAKKQNVRFVCSDCGAVYTAWAGRCAECGEWNTLQEEVLLSNRIVDNFGGSGRVLSSQSIDDSIAKDYHRLLSGISDIDLVLGGGLVSGSVVLLAGQPGIGKSTILLQLAYALSKTTPVLYVSGEESAHQVGLRAKRLKVERQLLQLATANVTDDIVATIAQKKYKVVIVDSIQSVGVKDIPTSAGTVSQITNSAQLLMQIAKQSDTAVILVGHVTKEGSIAGPKVLEHVVDVVLYLEGDKYGGFKVLRSTKNRFGSTNETGIFEMTDKGLQTVQNPSESLLAERQISDGSVVLATMEGSRSILVEIQALVNRTSYGYPKRTSSGFDLNRLNLLVAVLEKRTKLNLADKDIYINVVGGLHISEPAADLAVCMALGSAAKGLILKDKTVVFGEVGLSGEVRHVPFIDKRITEAKKLGFNSAIGPQQMGSTEIKNLETVFSVREALNTYLKSSE